MQDSGSKPDTSGVEPAKPEKVQPETAEPAKPEKVQPSKPDVPSPAEPAVGNSEDDGQRPEQAETNSSSNADSASEKGQGSSAQVSHARHTTPAAAHGQQQETTPELVSEPITHESAAATGTSTARDDAQPRAPDEAPAPDVERQSDSSPAAPAPCSPPASSLTSANTGCIGGLRSAHAILPGSPDLSDTAAALVAQRDIGPDINTRSAETTASPD
ncbi:hypothetical protein QFW96_21195 [Saccharopolyspora sp. TS4A08]|uniref:Uncharacterized protein n=1 Tax=Saccharopolyspora ipomoeae TaxID=3042027 RepID=A0ABT6PT19_9PSEU|nr:hypothetical protein [Saccharopolyspora sp. TS4A08]